MRIFLNKTVYEAGLDRVRWLFDNFANPVVAISGGKDSTIVFNLAMIVAKERGRLPLKVMFVDQEAEWQATIDHVSEIMEMPEVEPRWYQMPLRLFNATSTQEHWLMCWNPDDEARWMRERVPYSVKENVYGTDRFIELFPAIVGKEYPDESTCIIAGVRGEESPGRLLGLTNAETFRGETWGQIISRKRQHYTMYPIYDWSYTDVWKAIHDNKWPYNRLYDFMYRWGVPVQKMRVSNVHHETSVYSLFYMQEVEPATYERLTQRLSGIDAAGKFGAEDYFSGSLPFMFRGWYEYRDFLLCKLIESSEWQDRFRQEFARHERLYGELGEEQLGRVHVNSILTNDWEFVKLKNFETRDCSYLVKQRRKRREQNV